MKLTIRDLSTRYKYFELLFELLDYVYILVGIWSYIILYKGDIIVSLSWGAKW